MLVMRQGNWTEEGWTPGEGFYGFRDPDKNLGFKQTKAVAQALRLSRC
jgi:hypothetical protein